MTWNYGESGDGLGDAAEPEGSVGKAELKFAAVFAEQKGQVLTAKKAELRCEELANGGKGVL